MQLSVKLSFQPSCFNRLTAMVAFLVRSTGEEDDHASRACARLVLIALKYKLRSSWTNSRTWMDLRMKTRPGSSRTSPWTWRNVARSERVPMARCLQSNGKAAWSLQRSCFRGTSTKAARSGCQREHVVCSSRNAHYWPDYTILTLFNCLVSTCPTTTPMLRQSWSWSFLTKRCASAFHPTLAWPFWKWSTIRWKSPRRFAFSTRETSPSSIATSAVTT